MRVFHGEPSFGKRFLLQISSLKLASILEKNRQITYLCCLTVRENQLKSISMQWIVQ